MMLSSIVFARLVLSALVVVLMWYPVTSLRGQLHSRHGMSRIQKMPSSRLYLDPTSRTKSYFDQVDQVDTAGGAGGSSSLRGLQGMENAWQALKGGGWRKPPPQIVSSNSEGNEAAHLDSEVQYDVVVCGGTLGIFYATALQMQGYKVCVVERGKIAGRPQEWNISKKEISALLRLNILSEADIARITGIEFNPVRVGFKYDTTQEDNGFEVYVTDILNLGVKPDVLIELAKQRFIGAGGKVLEGASLTNIDLYSNLAEVKYTTTVPSDGESSTSSSSISTRLVLDAMGNGSPISKQIRGPVEPDGICVVVGTCASGYDQGNNTYSDVIYTDTPLTTIEPPPPPRREEEEVEVEVAAATTQLQYFWEAFPSGSGPTDRTTYLFTYMDAKPERPSIMKIMDDYWDLLPRYQGRNIDEDLKLLRVLFGCFPTYRASPLQSPYSRILQVGDASGIQSPLSFGGFGSLTRHLQRIVDSLSEALDNDFLAAEDLRLINAYQPNLSVGWMFQRAMSVPVGKKYDQETSGTLVIDTLTNSFAAMQTLGDATMRPFLQDVIQFGPLLRTLLLAGKRDLLTPLKIVPHVGLTAMIDFVYHFVALGWYTFMSENYGPGILERVAREEEEALQNPEKQTRSAKKERFRLKRQVDAWKFGSGLDYYDHE